MIHYHGTSLGGTRDEAARFLMGRHALVPYTRPEDLGAVTEFCQSFVLDNGAFTVWKKGGQLDIDGYTAWCDSLKRHPGFDWALIPDVIEGTDEANDALIEQWPDDIRGVPVYHMHEPIERMMRLAEEWQTVAIGSSGEYPNPGSPKWWQRMTAIMDTICDKQGRPPCRIHGLRMLNPSIFGALPLASADSTNVAQNACMTAWSGTYRPATQSQRMAVIAERVETQNSAPIWVRAPQQELALEAL